MAKISIIVPVYCAETYLRRCLESILYQTEKDLEIILIDDGSLDGSGLICDDFARFDMRIKVIHQINSGVSVARNNGIAIATGKYIGFIDSDDWIKENMYEDMLEEAERSGAEIVICDATTVHSDGSKSVDTIRQLSKSITLPKKAIVPNVLLELAGSVWRCIYKREIIKENNIEFPIGLKFSEDRVFNILCMGSANQIRYLKKAYYYRYINLTSAVHRFHADYFEIIKSAYHSTLFALDIAWNGNSKLKKAYLGQFIGGSFAAINNYFYKTCPWGVRKRINSTKAICTDKELRDAIIRSGNISGRAKWILNYNILTLCLYSILANIKNKR